MAPQAKIAKGSLRKATNRKNENSPEYIGAITFAEDVRRGQKLWLAAWVNVGDDGTKYFSISATEPTEQPRRAAPMRDSEVSENDLPF